MGVVRDKLNYLSGTKRLLREAINAVLADRGDPLLTESDPFENYPSALWASSPAPSAGSLTGSAADKLLRLNETKYRLREAINAELAIGLTESDPFRFYGESIWTPRALFIQGEQGAFYLPEPQYLYQDAAGTTPVTADGDPVGLMLGLSGNDNHASQAVSADRPVYRTDGGLHWLSGDGVGDTLSASLPTTDINTAGAFISLAARVNANKLNYFAALSNGSSNSQLSIRVNASGQFEATTKGADGKFYYARGPAHDADWHVFTIRLLGDSLVLRVDGMEYTGTISATTKNINLFSLLTLPLSGTGTAKCDIAGVVMRLTDVSQAGTIDSVESYLANLAGVTL